MNKVLLHTPDGVRDVYGSEYSDRLIIENKIHNVIKSYGYSDIDTPTFEFFDVLQKRSMLRMHVNSISSLTRTEILWFSDPILRLRSHAVHQR